MIVNMVTMQNKNLNKNFINTKIGPQPSLAISLSSIITAIVTITHMGMNIFYSFIESNLTGLSNMSFGTDFTLDSSEGVTKLMRPVNLLSLYAQPREDTMLYRSMNVYRKSHAMNRLDNVIIAFWKGLILLKVYHKG